MLASIPSTLFTEWKAYSKVNPFGEWRADLRAGIIASVIAEVNRNSKSRKRPYAAHEFMPKFEFNFKAKVVHTIESLKDKILRAFGV